jgi:3-oxoacyl-[acyl-carrier protein] reductase
MRLEGKIALVTGAGSGIGKCIAEIAMADINAEAAKSAARATGNNAIALRCDVSQKAEIDGVVEETLAAFGTLDILVNNAGATHVNKPAVEISEAEYDRIFAVNVKGIFLSCQAVIPAFRKRGGGVIIIDRRIASTPRAVGLQRLQRRRPRLNQVARRRARS